MAIKATIRVGKGCNITLDAESPVELVKRASQFTQLPSKCGHCDSENLGFMHRTAGDKNQYDYLHLKCNDCGAQCDIGQNETPKGNIFFKFQPKDRSDVKGGFYKYWEQEKKGGSSSGGGGQQSQSDPGREPDYGPPDDDDSIPF